MLESKHSIKYFIGHMMQYNHMITGHVILLKAVSCWTCDPNESGCFPIGHVIQLKTDGFLLDMCSE